MFYFCWRHWLEGMCCWGTLIVLQTNALCPPVSFLWRVVHFRCPLLKHTCAPIARCPLPVSNANTKSYIAGCEASAIGAGELVCAQRPKALGGGCPAGVGGNERRQLGWAAGVVFCPMAAPALYAGAAKAGTGACCCLQRASPDRPKLIVRLLGLHATRTRLVCCCRSLCPALQTVTHRVEPQASRRVRPWAKLAGAGYSRHRALLVRPV
jgi:hypothetical protein